MEPMVRAFEHFWEVQFPEPQRARWLDNDPLAVEAAWSAARAERAITDDLGRWQSPCLIFLGVADVDFLEGAHRAAEEIPRAELVVLEEADHYAAHMSQDEAPARRGPPNAAAKRLILAGPMPAGRRSSACLAVPPRQEC